MRSDRPDRLVVWMHAQPIAELTDRAQRGVDLRYLPAVLDRYDRNVPLLSCSLPVQPKRVDATSFFDGVLPEAPHRSELAARAEVIVSDTFGLLARYGRDVAGALVVMADDEPPPTVGSRVIALSDDDLVAEVTALPERPLGIHDDSELSLAGLQDKMLLVDLGGGRWGRPVAGAPSTHILKLDHRVHTGVVAAEAAALALARHTGLTDIATRLTTVAGVECLIVSRFDRIPGENGHVARVHQEDMCQALGLPPSTKYELRQGGGGPEFEQVADLIDLHARDVPTELDKLASIAAFTAIIGNADAHGKNLAFLHEPHGSIRLAPLYDTVPTVLWNALVSDAAMSIGGTVTLSAVDSSSIAREARRWRHDPTRAQEAAARTAASLLDAVERGIIDSRGDLAAVVRARAPRFIG